LTLQLASHRLSPVRRPLAALLALALIAAPAATASLHVHDYADHDHPQHHHGPASHEHGRHDHPVAPASIHTRGLERHDPPENLLESCDPGRHSVAVKMSCAQSPQLHLSLAELSGSVSIPLPARARLMRSFRDIRVHGPPFDPHTPSRAPPLTPHA
jgi:hypothetical protein